MKRDMKAWREDLIRSKAKQAMPILSFPCVQLMDITVEQLTSDPALQARGMQLVAERTPACASVSMMDLSVEAEAFGAQTRYMPGEMPTVMDAIVLTPQDAEALRVPPVGAGRTGIYVEAIRQACRLITDRPVLSGVIGPFSLAGRLTGLGDIMIACYDEPEAVRTVLEKATDFLEAYVLAYKAIGAHGVVIAEPMAGLLSPALSKAFSEPYVRRIAQAARSDDFLVIYHNCGNNTPLMLDSILRTGCDGYHFGDAVALPELVGRVPRDLLVMGNVSPSAQFLGGTPKSIRKETLRLLEACSPGHPNYIISSGCDIPSMSPWENINAFFTAVNEYYAGVLTCQLMNA
ncbi:MAG: uroporphyrinogen decarboxylase family protein [Eubacteriales bacterium]|nr:uroporphyrinogen decarboxylase family protein [Eubacteriales bacterium]